MTILILFLIWVVCAYWCIFLHWNGKMILWSLAQLAVKLLSFYLSLIPQLVCQPVLTKSQVSEHGFQTLIACVQHLFCHYIEQLIIICLCSKFQHSWKSLPFMICWLCRDMLPQGSDSAASTSHCRLISYALCRAHKKKVFWHLTDFFWYVWKTPSKSWFVTGGETNTDRWPTGSAQKGGLGSFVRFCSWRKTWVKLALDSWQQWSLARQ